MRSFLFSSYSAQPTPSTPTHSLLTKPCCPSSDKASTKAIFCDTPRLAPSASHHSQLAPKYVPGITEDDDDDDQDDKDLTVIVAVQSVGSASSSCSSTSSVFSDFYAAMSIRSKAKKEAGSTLPPSSPPSTTTSLCKPTTSTSPVQIPRRNYREASHHGKRETSHRRRNPKISHSSDSISPSVAALLAVTDIPQRRRRRADKNLTVDEIVSDEHVSEKDLSLSLGRGPMDLLLSAPEDLMDDELSATESNMGSMLARTTSADSVPSLGGESFATDTASSVETPRSIGGSTRRRHSPMRRSLEPVRSPPDDVAAEQHPLAAVDDLSLEELELPAEKLLEEDTTSFLQPFKPLRSAFKSNLTASLRALRSAAKSFSSINFPSIPPDDFLTRSILTIDPNVPYMDERRPPVTEEMPSAELRRYLNPTTSAHIDPQPKTGASGTFSASIQMQTYKVQRSRSAPPSSRSPSVHGGTSPSASAPNQHPSKSGQQGVAVPGMRQREMRENPDFIRIAVMEMAMRRRGKLDNQKPGRARWALPPRKTSLKPYEVGANGIPTRWVPVTQSC